MSGPFKAPALSPSHRYLIALLSRFRRFINRSVASTLASRERQVMRFITVNQPIAHLANGFCQPPRPAGGRGG